MSKLPEIVDSLENRVSKLLHRYEKQKQTTRKLEEELHRINNEREQYQQEIDRWKEKCESLKLANSMLGSDQHKRETKLKINALVREIDQCIRQLTE